MESNRDDNRNLDKAQHLAREYIQLLKDWIPRREKTIKALENIAIMLEIIEAGTDVGKVMGTATAVVGGLASVAGIFATGGLATPFFIGGIVGSVAGSATTVTSTVIGDVTSRGQVKKAQKVIDKEKESVRNFEEKKKELDEVVEEISVEFEMEADDVMNMLLMTTIPEYYRHRTHLGVNVKLPSLPSFNTLMILKAGLMDILCRYAFSMSKGMISPLSKGMVSPISKEMVSPISKRMGKVFADLSIISKNVSKILGTVLRGSVAGALLIWDVASLVQTISNISQGSGSKTAKALRDIARQLQQQIDDVSTLMVNMQEKAAEFEDMLREKFRKLLGTVSAQGYATANDEDEMKNLIDVYACDEWKNSSVLTDLDFETFAMNNTFPLARIVDNLIKTIQERDDEEEKDGQIITVIAHGSINTSSMKFPCQFYYMTRNLKKITLYEPWGCAIDATVVHGIVTNTISINNVRYSDSVYPALPNDWNHLPRDMSLIPTTVLYPVKIGEPAYQELEGLFEYYSRQFPEGIIIPYFIGSNTWLDLLPYPKVPLCVFTAALSIAGIILGKNFTLRVAACLSAENPEYGRGLVDCNQYCVVDRKRNVNMKHIMPIRPDWALLHFDALNRFLQ